MITIGLTGGIASGKSTVAQMLEQEGAHLIDADRVAREVVLPGTEAWAEIKAWLGSPIIGPGGAIDRRRLGELIFADPAARQRLNAIVHPRVFETFSRRAEEIRRRDPGAVLVYDVPLLIESGMNRMVDLVLLVYLPLELQRRRLQKRDSLSSAEIDSRIETQMPLEEKRVHADIIINNRGSREQTRRQVQCFWMGLRGGGFG